MRRLARFTMAQIEIYTTRYGCYCFAAKALLQRNGVPYTEVDVSGDPQRREQMIERANGRMTVLRPSSERSRGAIELRQTFDNLHDKTGTHP